MRCSTQARVTGTITAIRVPRLVSARGRPLRALFCTSVPRSSRIFTVSMARRFPCGPAPGRAATAPLLRFCCGFGRGPAAPGEEEERRDGENWLGERLLLASRTPRATARPLVSTSGYVCGQTSLWHVSALPANGSRCRHAVCEGRRGGGQCR